MYDRFGLILILFLFAFGSCYGPRTTDATADTSSSARLGKEGNKGAIVTLVKANPNAKPRYKILAKHNQGIEQFLYMDGIDVIIFHEGELVDAHQKIIAKNTPNLPLQFVDVTETFKLYKEVNNSFCPRLQKHSSFGPGYMSMCRFWFVDFIKYLASYDWVLRLDEDCLPLSDLRGFLADPKLTSEAHLSSSLIIDLSLARTDAISEKGPDGAFVQNMKAFVRNFVFSNKSPLLTRFRSGTAIHTWRAPYTNCMFLNLNWYRSNKMLGEFDQAVLESQCIYSGRWGDLPLWGAKMLLAYEQIHVLNFSYHHLSHRVKVIPGKIYGRALSRS